jgi:hypothetical protein
MAKREAASEQKSQKTPPHLPVEEEEPKPKPARQVIGQKEVKTSSHVGSFYVAPSREGKLHVSAWLHPSYKAMVRAIQVTHPEKNLQTIYAEALDDLFKKYHVSSFKRPKNLVKKRSSD